MTVTDVLLDPRMGWIARIDNWMQLHPKKSTSLKTYTCPKGCLSFTATRPPDLTVLMVGPIGAGKTTYIASLPLSQQNPVWFQHFPDVMQGPNEDEQRWPGWNRSDFRRYWESRGALGATRKRGDQHTPLIAAPGKERVALGNYGFYAMQVEETGLDYAPGEVLLMDSPGEAFGKGFLDLLNHAGSGVRDAPLLMVCVDIHDDLEREIGGVVNRLAGIRPTPGHLAVLYTKSDLLWDDPDFPDSLKADPDPNLTPEQYRKQLEQDSEAAQAFLKKKCKNSIISAAQTYDSCSFHMVSATSCAAEQEGTYSTYPFVRPVRLLDPFIYYYLKSYLPR